VTIVERVESHLYIKSGWKSGIVATLPGQGDEGVHALPGDVDIELVVTPDKLWSWDGHNLVYSAELSLVDALCGTIIEVPTLDGRLLSVPVTQVVAPGHKKIVPGEGMPCESSKGDLVLHFDIKFPTSLSIPQKAAVKAALS